MKLQWMVGVCAVVVGGLAVQGRAEQITSFTDSLSTADVTELGRASRSGVPQTWAGQEAYSGQLNVTTTYFYKTYDFAASDFAGAPYVEVTVNDVNNSAAFFVSAYAGTYDSSHRGSGWLGDEGGSGNYFGTDPRSFDVTLLVGQDLVLLVNSTLGGTNGLLQPFDIDVAAYADTSYDEPVVTPEPGTLLMTLTGMLGAVGVVRRRVGAGVGWWCRAYLSD